MWKVIEQPSVGLKCLYRLLYPPNIFELLISVGFVSITLSVRLRFAGDGSTVDTRMREEVCFAVRSRYFDR